MVSKVRPTKPLLTQKTIETRLFKAKRLLHQLKKQKSGTVRIFSDKKINQAQNHRNDRVVVKKGAKAKPKFKTQPRSWS